MLVFALYKREAARLEQFLQRNNYDAVAVHGDKGQASTYSSTWQAFFCDPSGFIIFVIIFIFYLGDRGGTLYLRGRSMRW